MNKADKILAFLVLILEWPAATENNLKIKIISESDQGIKRKNQGKGRG